MMATQVILEYQLIYPADGESAIVEVCAQDGKDLLHVSLDLNDGIQFTFFCGEPFTINSVQLDEITKFAKANLSAIAKNEL
ncbi:MAG: hypothetical protein AAF754_20270 [Pseudomonadota bacterium]